MIKKTLLAIGASIALSVSATTVSADGLTLINKTSSAITVSCNGKPGQNIPANGQLPALPWGLIVLMFSSTDMDCQFKLTDNSLVGSSHIKIDMTRNTGIISNVWSDPTYSVSADHNWNQPNSEMSVSIAKNA